MLDGSWERRGRGLTRSFYALDDEVVGWLDQVLEPDLDDYTLLCREAVVDGPGRPVSWRTDATSVSEWPSRWSQDRWNWFLWPHRRMPDLPMPVGAQIPAWALHGLINIQHPMVDERGRRLASSIGLVHEIVRLSTGQRRRHDQALRLYRTLERTIRDHARLATVRVTPDGSTIVDTDLALMTARARDAARSGAAFDVLPADDPATNPTSRAG